MNDTQRSEDAQWRLQSGEVRSLRVGPGTRLLRVSEGPLWLTMRSAGDTPPEDIWLEAGDSIALADHAEVVIEGWPRASFQLLVPPQACPGRRPMISAWLSSLRAAA